MCNGWSLTKTVDQIMFRKLNTGFRKAISGKSSITKHVIKFPLWNQNWIIPEGQSKQIMFLQSHRSSSEAPPVRQFPFRAPPLTSSQLIETQIERSNFKIGGSGVYWHDFLVTDVANQIVLLINSQLIGVVKAAVALWIGRHMLIWPASWMEMLTS